MSETLLSIAESIHSGAVSAQSLATEALAKAEEFQEFNAFISLDPEGALADALRVDQAIAAGDTPGRLAGVPLAIKDNINVQDLRTTAGTAGIDFVPSTSAPIISRLKSEGAVIIGKTNMHELAFGVTSNNAAFGTVHNPIDPMCIPGGSSGGTAAAIAAGIVPGGLGTDTAGSVRVPAALTGLAGFRPTRSLVDQTGIVPSVPTFDVAGPLAQTVSDAALLYAVMTGKAAAKQRPVTDIRIGLPTSYFENLSPGVCSAVEQALHQVERAGAILKDIDITPISTASFEVGFPIGFHEMKTAMTGFLAQYQPGTSLEEIVERIAGKDVKDVYTDAVLGDGAPSPADYKDAVIRMTEIRRDYLEMLATNQLDILAFPTTPLEAPPIEGAEETVLLNGEAVPTLPTFMRNVASTGVCDAPGLTLPLKRTGGSALPTGLEIDGRPGEDVELLGIGIGIETLLAEA
ncbi:amidase family protein [Roseibium sp. SCP14]|uniref:amidase family protein n=1 Tax=Roseibium sp. SCP14 TaxID=3141375 RepID=UPI00333A74BF